MREQARLWRREGIFREHYVGSAYVGNVTMRCAAIRTGEAWYNETVT